MGKELMLHYPSVLDSIRSMDRVLQDLEHSPPWLIEGKTISLNLLTSDLQ